MIKTKLMVLMLTLLIMVFPVRSIAGEVTLPKTGQIKCYDASGNLIDCTNTGQDGDIQAGIEWPSPRFVDNADGTITDNLTGLIWLKNANCFGAKTWSQALGDCNNLSNGSCSLSDASVAGDWRLPNIIELQSLVSLGESDLSGWLSSNGFTNVQSSLYYTSTTRSDDSDKAWIVSIAWGDSGNGDKTFSNYIWPVRGGQDGIVKNWQTGQTTSYATGDDGDLRHGEAWPSPRFLDNDDGTVTDNLTGLIWLKDANCINTNYSNFDNDSTIGDGAVTWQHALNFVSGVNSGTYSKCTGGHSNWRLPNRTELFSLIDYSRNDPALPSSHPFTNVQSDIYWSSNTHSNNEYFLSRAWRVKVQSGYIYWSPKSNSYYVWLVRDAQKKRNAMPWIPLLLIDE